MEDAPKNTEIHFSNGITYSSWRFIDKNRMFNKQVRWLLTSQYRWFTCWIASILAGRRADRDVGDPWRELSMTKWQNISNHINNTLRQHFHHTLILGIGALLGILGVLLIINEANWRPLKNKIEWNVRSNYSNGGAPFAIDQDLKTYWTSYVPITSGMFFQIDIGRSALINGIL